jgi:hypothetical protein
MVKQYKSIAQRKLLTLWLIAAAPPFMIMVGQTMLGRFGDSAQEAWAWLLPTVMPTLVLVVGTVVTNAIRGQPDRRIDSFYWKLAAGLSIFYLTMVTLVLMASTVLTSPKSPIPLMVQSNLFLAPVQGLVGAALGVFFVSSDSRPANEAGDAVDRAAGGHAAGGRAARSAIAASRGGRP